MSDIFKSAYPVNDANYINAEQYGEPKELFKLVLGRLSQVQGGVAPSILDVGCASGAFLYHAGRALGARDCVGIDIAQDLLDQAAANVPGCAFVNASVSDIPLEWNGRFDACTCIGVLSLFDDIATELEAMLRCVRPGGHVLIVDLVNDDPIDVVMRFRCVAPDTAGDWRPGFNVRSRATYDRLLGQLCPGGSWRFDDFEMPFDIPRTDDPTRSWTVMLEGRRQIVVGTGQMLNIKLLTIGKE